MAFREIMIMLPKTCLRLCTPIALVRLGACTVLATQPTSCHPGGRTAGEVMTKPPETHVVSSAAAVKRGVAFCRLLQRREYV